MTGTHSLLNRIFLCLSAALLSISAIEAVEVEKAEIVSVRKLWDKPPHSAFTDLVFHKGRWFCVFREGMAHVSPDGALQVLTSADGENWESAARITSKEGDLRDAKIDVTPDGRLMLCGAAALFDKSGGTHQSYVWYSSDGREWGEAIPVGDRGFWLWRVTWHDGVAYAVGYAASENKSTRLYRSTDGKTFTTLVKTLSDEGFPNESSLLFLKDGTALCLMRRDDADGNARLGTAKAPYTDWTWKKLNEKVGGPQIKQLEDGRILVAGRRYRGKDEGGPKTVLWQLDPQAGHLTELAVLPSGGDTSYPGLVFRDGQLWMSYYSSHEDKKTEIYLAKLKLPKS